MENQYCTLCKNHCPLNQPKCTGAEAIRKRQEVAGKERHCAMCPERCLMTELCCELGEMIACLREKSEVDKKGEG